MQILLLLFFFYVTYTLQQCSVKETFKKVRNIGTYIYVLDATEYLIKIKKSCCNIYLNSVFQ